MPGPKPEIVLVFCPLLQNIVYGLVPPVIFKDKAPSILFDEVTFDNVTHSIPKGNKVKKSQSLIKV